MDSIDETPKKPTTLPVTLTPDASQLSAVDIPTDTGEIRDPLAQDQLDVALAAAKTLKSKSLSPNTQRAYLSDWRAFIAWCQKTQVTPLPAKPDVIQAFVGQQAYPPDEKTKAMTVSTVRRRLAAIDLFHEYKGYPPPSKNKQVRLAVQGMRREFGTKPVKKAALSVADVKHMADLCGDQGARALRDRALLLFGFASAMRRAELVALDKKNLTFSWVDKDGELVTGPKPKEHWTLLGVNVDILDSKTDKEKSGTTIAVPANTESPYCPVRALLDWLAIEHVGDPAVFIRVSKGDTLLFKERKRKDDIKDDDQENDDEDERIPKPSRLTSQSVALLIKSYAKQLDLEADDYSGHSFRRGWITAAAKKKGANLVKIAEHSRHKSMDVLRGYIDDAKKLEDHAGAELL